MKELRIYVFDLDDTLVLEEDYVRSGCHHLDQVLKTRHGIAGFYEQAMELHSSGYPGYLINETLERLRVPDMEEMLILAYREYRNHFPQLTLQEDAAELLRFLKRRRLPTGLISDGPWESQQNKVRAAQIERWIDKIILTDLYGREFWKPHPRAYIEMEEHFASPPETMAYIADNPAKDFITPRQRGWWTVQIQRKRPSGGSSIITPESQAHKVISSLAELLPNARRG